MPNSRGQAQETKSHFSTQAFNLLGLRVQGDIGAYTTYTDRRGRKVVFYYSPPTKPPTAPQIRCRARFAMANALWQSLTLEEKAALEDCTRRLSLPWTGKNLWISCSLKNLPEQYLTAERQSGIALPTLIITGEPDA